ncbi:hypothetical protein DRN67_04510 [Candidatus Micrarchaeota archaeon]|nr:MAG: hypothetical protein DRN67_04510 [Candidatus Micrarchaeota archaeon]
MFISRPVFPISFQLEQVAKLVEGLLRKKNWKDFKQAELKLVLTPFYVFYYDAGFEEQKQGKSIVKGTKRGRGALDALSGEINEQLAESMPSSSELVKELPDDYPLEVKEPVFSESEAKKIAQLKTAAMLKTAKESVIISDFRTIYYPMWVAGISVGKQNYELEISAITGEIFGEEKVPERQQGFVEITKETLQELKKPGAWLKYGREVADTAREKLSGGERGVCPKALGGKLNLPNIMWRPGFWISVALLIILIAIIIF